MILMSGIRVLLRACVVIVQIARVWWISIGSIASYARRWTFDFTLLPSSSSSFTTARLRLDKFAFSIVFTLAVAFSPVSNARGGVFLVEIAVPVCTFL